MRIASAIYVLVHDGRGPIRSVLTQLGKRNEIDYLSTAGLVTERCPITLVMTRIRNKQARFIPMCMDPGKWGFFHDLPFTDWWKEPIFRAESGETYARWQIVLAFRNKDGGSHYDHVIDDDVYIELRGFDGGDTFDAIRQQFAFPDDVTRALPDGRFPVPHGHDSIIRQIAWELDFSLGRAGLVQNSPQFRDGQGVAGTVEDDAIDA